MQRKNSEGQTEVAFVWDVLPDESDMGWVEYDPAKHGQRPAESLSWKVWDIDFGWLPW